MGDVAMAVPVVYSLATQYPNIRITVLSRNYARPFFEDLAPNVGFMDAELKKNKGVHGLNVLYRRLAAKHFTSIADFHDVLRTKYLRLRFNLEGSHVAHVNKHNSSKRHLIEKDEDAMHQQPTSFENYADVLAKLGYPVKLDFTSIFGPEGGNLNLLPAAIGAKKNFEQWIGIAPFAAHEGKTYPLPLMEKVVSKLSTDYPSARIFIFGGQHVTPTVDEWISKYPRCMNIAYKLEGIPQEIILISHLDVMVSMDSANMHFASLVNVPVVSIWGATHPYAGFMGWNQKIENAIQKDMPCRPCSIYGNKKCIRGDYECLNIDPQLIIDKVKKILEQKAEDNL